MASLPAYKVNDFIKNFARDVEKNSYRLWLLYGPEGGLSAERQDIITKSICPDKDPFRFSQLPQHVILDDPAKFFDEMLAMSFDGGKRLVVITEVDERLYEKALADFFKQPVGDNYLLLVAGNLDKRSQLRTMVEGAGFAIALPAYQDDEKTILQLLKEQLAFYNVRMTTEAQYWLSQQLGGNRLETKQLIEQICLYGIGGEELTLDAIRPFINVSHETVDKFINAVLTKDSARVVELQDKLRTEKIEPIQLIRRMMIELNRLQNIHDEVAGGGNLDSVIERLVPFFKNRPIVRKAVTSFRRDKLSFWRGKLLQLEDQTKSSLPGHLLTERFFLQLSKSRY
ncbi:MAG: DNA polymerase III subunit delta [Hydrotalea sp.]|nr:DNA polymerase III subunit delta [Hydrotalea sp.]